MNELDNYKLAVQRLAQFKRWRSMIGREYFGGTRGKGGEFGSVVSGSCSLTIYFQESDGAKNYHESDASFVAEFGKAAILCSPGILAAVQIQLEQQVTEARQSAETIAKSILQSPIETTP